MPREVGLPTSRGAVPQPAARDAAGDPAARPPVSGTVARMTSGDGGRERPVPGNLDVRWHAGWPSPKHDPAPEIQVHRYDTDTVILRQNKSVHYEAPFMFLLFGAERALLLDTGATEEERYFPLRSTVDGLVAEWLERHPQACGRVRAAGRPHARSR